MRCVIVLEAGPARAEVDADHGGRIASLAVDGVELLVGPHPDPMAWGCFPMVPWAGRVRHGRFTFAGVEHQLAINLPPHAIHGTGFTRPWTAESDHRLTVDLQPGWPFPGHAVHEVRLEPDHLALRLEVHADRDPMPASCGWHPWWRRRLSRGGPGEPVLPPARMYARDADGIPTGELVDPPPGPWDDGFTDLAAPPGVRWPGALEITVTSTCDHVVVYDEQEDGLCVEPQTGPPDALNLAPVVVEPAHPLVAEAQFRWRSVT